MLDGLVDFPEPAVEFDHDVYCQGDEGQTEDETYEDVGGGFVVLMGGGVSMSTVIFHDYWIILANKILSFIFASTKKKVSLRYC